MTQGIQHKICDFKLATVVNENYLKFLVTNVASHVMLLVYG